MQLSTHFSREELTTTQVRQDNTPTFEVDKNLILLASSLEQVRSVLKNNPMSISSGYRSPVVNLAVGGASNSAHMRGLAADFTCPAFGTPKMIVDAIASSNIDFDQCIVEFNRWVHFAIPQAGKKGRKQVFEIGA